MSLRLYDTRHPDGPVHDYGITWLPDGLRITAGIPAEPHATVTADATAWSRVLFHGVPTAAAQDGGLLSIEGDQTLVDRLAALFAPQ